MRIVSLIASATEIVCALGLQDRLVGRSHECDFPESVTSLPICTEIKLNVQAPSADIDRQVRRIVSEGLSVYRVKPDMLAELKPDLIITQTQCEVCAVSLKDVEAAVCQIAGPSAKIVSLHPNTLNDVWGDIRCVAGAAGVGSHGDALVQLLQERMWIIEHKATALPHKPRVAYIEWVEPLMCGGNWMPELVEMAGGVNLFGSPGVHSPLLKWPDLVAADPDVIVISPCGYTVDRTLQDVPLLQAKPEWAGLKAVREGRVVVADGNAFFNRPGSRIVESLEILAEIFYPEQFDYGHHRKAWQTL